jgi:hypothetical protein
MYGGLLAAMLIALAPFSAGAASVSQITESSSYTGGVRVSSGSTSTTDASASVRSVIRTSGGRGTVIVEITKEENGVRSTERREERIEAGRPVTVSVSTSSGRTSATSRVSVAGDAKIMDVATGTSIVSTGTTKVTENAMASTSLAWLLQPIHEFIAQLSAIFAGFFWNLL